MRSKYVLCSTLALGALALLLSHQSPSRAAAPDVMQYQGRLTDASGRPREGTIAKLTFRIYSTAAPSSATFVWGEAHTNVPVRRGVFTVNLGEGDLSVDVNGTETSGSNPLSATALSGSDRYVEVQVDSAPPLAPTSRLGSVPFAIVAGGSTPVGGIIDWYRPDQATLPPTGWVICDGQTVNDQTSPFHNKAVPDLRGVYTKGAALSAGYGAPTGGGFGLPDTGGQNTISLSHSHGVANHNHSVSFAGVETSLAGAHSHNATLGDVNGHLTPNTNPIINHNDGQLYAINTLTGFGPNCSHNFPVTVRAAPGHRHTLSGGVVTTSSGGSTNTANQSFSNEPQYVGLVKIIRIR